MDVTLLEVHLDDATFTANAPFSGRESGNGVDQAVDEEIDQSAETPSAVGAVVGLLALALLALAARRLLRGGQSSIDVGTAPESETVTT